MSDERHNNQKPLTALLGVTKPLPQSVLNVLRQLRHRGFTRFRTARSLLAALLAGAALPLIMGMSTAPNSAQASSSELCQGYSGCSAHGYPGHDYGQHSSTSYWRMAAGDECTNYVAFVESTVYHAPTPGYLLGNGGQWAATASAHGVAVNRTPAVGAVAVWDGGTFGMGPLGHVAVVERVGPHASYIEISQQNIGSDTDGYDWTRINAGHPSDRWQEWPSSFIHFRTSKRAAVGYFNPASHSFRLRDSLSTGPADFAVSLGSQGAVPLTGSWNRGGGSGIGYYSPRDGRFHLRAWPQGGTARYDFSYGPARMIPLAGDWTGSGRDSVGYYDPANGTFHLRASLSAGGTYRAFTFGPPGMIPLTGNWDGGRSDGVGYYNPRSGSFHLRDSLSAGQASYTVRFGPRGMIPLAGNWAGGSKDSIGFYNPRDGWFHLRDSLTTGKGSFTFKLGPGGMIPLAGDWPGA